MGDEVVSQAAAWRLYDDWLRDGGVFYIEEPPTLESAFRSLTWSNRIAPKDWADSYLAAFASESELTFVTFDQGFHGKVKRLIVLTP
jgi:uncharacterized protein